MKKNRKRTAVKKEEEHKCSCEFCGKESGVLDEDWHVAGCGETLERGWRCLKCGKTWREVYIFSCMIDDDTGKTI